MAAREIVRAPTAFKDSFGRPYEEVPAGGGRGWLIDGVLWERNPLLAIDQADLDEAFTVLRLWRWAKGTSLVQGLAAGSYGPLPNAGGVGDQPAALLDAFEELQTADLEDLPKS